MNEHVFIVDDMTCGHCKKRIETALGTLPGDKTFTVELPTKKVTVQSALTDEAIAAVIDEAGYTPRKA
jgi:copper chaperone